MRLIVLLLLLLSPICKAEEVTQWIIPPEPGQITQNIHLVVDFSGSMGADRVSAAIAKTLEIVSTSVDEVNIKVTVFGKTFQTWEGVPNEKQPGWTALPDANAIAKLNEWLRSVSIDDSATRLSGPLFLAASEKIQKTIIVISDMYFDDVSCIDSTDYSNSTLGFIGLYPTNNTIEYVQDIIKRANGFFCVIRHGEE